MRYLIKHAVSLGLWSSLDIQFSDMLVSAAFPYDDNQNTIKKTVLMFASACLSSHIKLGHTCLPMYLFSSNTFFKNYFLKLEHKEIQKIKKLTIDDWKELLLTSSAVSNGSYIAPLVLENDYLYLYRMWQEECIIAQFLNYTDGNQNYLKNKIIDILHKLFPNTSKKKDWHKIATAISLIHSKIFISGGPGTGKTSIISKIITALLLYNNELNIKTAATTGKAAAVLTSSCANIINYFKQLDQLYQYKPVCRTITLHNLLGSRLYQKTFQNFLDVDCLIIDESSMISLSLLSKLILVLPKHAKVIFVGDHHQLYPVESGSIFQDICKFIKFGYSVKQQQILHELIQATCITANIIKKSHDFNHISDKICVLKENYRFNQTSGIGQLACFVKSGNFDRSLSILTSKIYADLHYIRVVEHTDYMSMLINCAKQYTQYLKILKNQQTSIIKILEIFNKYRILCALKYGLFGIKQLNDYIEQILNCIGLITLNQSKNYIGKPIMILRNDPLLGLCNGDVGILLPNTQNNLSAYFLDSTHEIKIVHLHHLPSYETCFAMTIHKSQGSEFQNVAIILPNKYLPILTRELIYTAITRAHQQIFIYATDSILIRSIKNVTKRYSGLYNKLKTHSKG